MIFITGPLYSGKRTFAQTLPGKRLSDVQVLAADAADLPALADKLAHEYDILIATEVGGGVVPMDVKQRADREAAGRLACLLAARAECVVQMFCGIPHGFERRIVSMLIYLTASWPDGIQRPEALSGPARHPALTRRRCSAAPGRF